MYIKSQEKRNSKLSGLAQSFFIMNYYAKVANPARMGHGRQRDKESELQNVPKLNCRYNTVQGCIAGFIRRQRTTMLPTYWD